MTLLLSGCRLRHLPQPSSSLQGSAMALFLLSVSPSLPSQPPLLSSLRTREDMSLFLRIDFPGSGSSRPIRPDLSNQYAALVGCRQGRAAGQVPCSLTPRARCRTHTRAPTKRGGFCREKVWNPIVTEMQRLNWSVQPRNTS